MTPKEIEKVSQSVSIFKQKSKRFCSRSDGDENAEDEPSVLRLTDNEVSFDPNNFEATLRDSYDVLNEQAKVEYYLNVKQ